MKRMLKRILVVLLVLILLAVAGFGMLYAGRLRTVNSIEQITAYDDYNLYRMDVKYDLSLIHISALRCRKSSRLHRSPSPRP